MSFAITTYSIRIRKDQSVSAEAFIPESPLAMLVLAHGAGAGMRHPFMNELSKELAHHQIASLRYNFLFMEQRKKRPDFPAVAHQAVEAAIQTAQHNYPRLPLFAGGKSFGGRMTSQYLSLHPQAAVKGIIFFGFPLHPAGKPSVDRADHLKNIQLPMLFLQGTRDSLAEWPLVTDVCHLLPTSTLVKLEGADHSFKIPKQNTIPLLAREVSHFIKILM
jgi:uncharacterized protein